MNACMSLAAMESQLKPQVLEKFDEIAGVYKKMHRLQDKRMETLHAGRLFSPASEKHYMKLKQELIELLDTVQAIKLLREFTKIRNQNLQEAIIHLIMEINRKDDEPKSSQRHVAPSAP